MGSAEWTARWSAVELVDKYRRMRRMTFRPLPSRIDHAAVTGESHGGLKRVIAAIGRKQKFGAVSEGALHIFEKDFGVELRTEKSHLLLVPSREQRHLCLATCRKGTVDLRQDVVVETRLKTFCGISQPRIEQLAARH